MASRWGASSWTASSTWESDHLVRLSLRVCSFFRPSLFPSFSFLPLLSLANFHAFALLFSPLFESRLVNPSSYVFTLASLFLTSFALLSRLVTVSLGVSVFHTVVVYSTSMLSVSMVAVWWFKCKLGSVRPHTQ